MGSFMKKYISRFKRSTLPNTIQLRFLKRLLRLLENGYPLIEALETMKWDGSLKKTASRMIALLKSGMPMDIALEKCNFNQAISGHLYFIRTNNDLVGSLRKCLDVYEHRITHVQKFQQTIRYPLLLFFIFAVLLFFIKQSVLPSFLDLFQSSSNSASTIQISIKIINFFMTLFFVSGFIVLLSSLLWLYYKKRLSIEKQLLVYRKIPIFRNYLRLSTSFTFAFHISSLLKTGMSFREIFLHISKQDKFPILSLYSKKITNELNKGIYINQLLGKFEFLEKDLSFIFQKNSDYEALEKDLEAYAEILTENLQAKIKKGIAFLQPISFIILAGFIVLVYMTLMWPMFQLIQTI